MPLLTNQLLEKLANALDAFAQATTTATDLGLPQSPNMPFYRMGEPVRMQVSPTSASTPVPVTLPPNVTSFMVNNLNPFPCRLRGTRQGGTFNAVSDTTGWVFMPGVSGPFTTVSPAFVSAQSVDGPFAKSDPNQKAGIGWLELQYGTGM